MGRPRLPETITRDAQALAMHCQGMSFQAIGDAMGMVKSSAFKAVKRSIADRQRDALGQVDHFTLAIERIHASLQRCEEIINTPHYAVAPGGKIATMWVTGEDGAKHEVPVLDDGPKQRAITEMRHLNDQLIVLMDLKPASKSRVEVVTEDVVDREIKKLADEIAAGQKAAASPVPNN